MTNDAPSIDDAFDAHAVLEYLRKRDPRLKRLFKAVGPFAPTWTNEGGPYDWLFRSIVYQQLHGKAAAAILGRVRALFKTKSRSPLSFSRWMNRSCELPACPEASSRVSAISRGPRLPVKYQVHVK